MYTPNNLRYLIKSGWCIEFNQHRQILIAQSSLPEEGVCVWVVVVVWWWGGGQEKESYTVREHAECVQSVCRERSRRCACKLAIVCSV